MRLLALILLILLLLPVYALNVESKTYTVTLKYLELVLEPQVESILKDAVLRVMIPLKKDEFDGCKFELRDTVLNKVYAFLLRCLDGDQDIILYPVQTWWTTQEPGQGWNSDLYYVGGEFTTRSLDRYPYSVTSTRSSQRYTLVTSLFHVGPLPTSTYDYIGISTMWNFSSTFYFRMLLNVPVAVNAVLRQTWLGNISMVWVNGQAYGSTALATSISSREFNVTLNRGLNLIAFYVTSVDVNADGFYDARGETYVRFKVPGYWIADALIRVPEQVQAGSSIRLLVLPSTITPRDSQTFKYWFDDFYTFDTTKYNIQTGSNTRYFVDQTIENSWLIVYSATEGVYAPLYMTPKINVAADMVFLSYGTTANDQWVDRWNPDHVFGFSWTRVIAGNGSAYTSITRVQNFQNPFFVMTTNDYFMFGMTLLYNGARIAILQSAAIPLPSFANTPRFTIASSRSTLTAGLDWVAIGVKPPRDYRGWQHYTQHEYELKTATVTVESATSPYDNRYILKVTFNTTIYGGDQFDRTFKFREGLLASVQPPDPRLTALTVFATRTTLVAQIIYSSDFTLKLGAVPSTSSREEQFTTLEELALTNGTLTLKSGNATLITVSGVPQSGAVHLVVVGDVRRVVVIAGDGNVFTVRETQATVKSFNATLSKVGSLIVMEAAYPSFRQNGLLGMKISGADGLGNPVDVDTRDGKNQLIDYDIEPLPNEITFGAVFIYPLKAAVTYYIEPQAVEYTINVPAVRFDPVTYRPPTIAPQGNVLGNLIVGLREFGSQMNSEVKTLAAVAAPVLVVLMVPVLTPPVAVGLALLLVLLFAWAGWLTVPSALITLATVVLITAVLMWRPTRL